PNIPDIETNPNIPDIETNPNTPIIPGDRTTDPTPDPTTERPNDGRDDRPTDRPNDGPGTGPRDGRANDADGSQQQQDRPHQQPPGAPPHHPQTPHQREPVELALIPLLVAPGYEVPPPTVENAGFELTAPAVAQGENISGMGYGCPAGAEVDVAIGGVPAGTTVADDRGAFQSTLDMGTVLPVGRYEVTAACGPVLAAALDVVLASNVDAATSTLTVIMFFLLIGVFVYVRRLLSPPPRPEER
ncbi:hypothetical protein, partial [Nocardia sp. NPDC058497]|uniref:hypothetical protein n=1 Tax=Nocardia sp. NPDC058497 TaxID=3346529 RepID=UPI0036528582